MTTYDEWKTRNPFDEYPISNEEREEGCECRLHVGDYKWCPVHGLDPDEEREKIRDRWIETHFRELDD